MSAAPVTLDMSTAQPLQAPVKLDMSTAQPIGAPAKSEPGFWDKVKDALHPRLPLDAPGAKPFHADSPLPGSSEGANFTEALSDYDKASGGEMGGGVVDILHGNVARGLHRIISGAGNAVTPLAPLAAPAAAAAPFTTALGIGGGVAGSKVAKAGAEGLGATPDQANLAGDVGGIVGGMAGAKLPALGQRAVLLGRTPEEAYQSALKPSTTIPPAKVDRIVQSGLQNEIPVSKAGAEKLQNLLEDLQDKVTNEIGAGQGKTINPSAVAQRADQIKSRFTNQVNPTADLSAIEASKQEFLQNNPNPIPADAAQSMKQGTYQQLKGKAYGEMKTATIEAQKALARGLKEELASAFPELSNLNAQESRLFDLQPVLEKAVQREGNHQIIGIGTPIMTGATKAVTGSTGASAVVGLLKAVVDNPMVKSRLAIALSKAGVPYPAAMARIQSYSGSLAGVVSSSSSATQDDHGNTQPQ